MVAHGVYHQIIGAIADKNRSERIGDEGPFEISRIREFYLVHVDVRSMCSAWP